MKSFIFVVLAITVVTADNFCTPGSTFKQNCNTCICSKDGRAAACTDMACPEEMVNKIDSTPEERYCEPGKRFQMDDCSTCVCSADGTKARCTLALCTGQRNVFSKSCEQKYCTPGTIFSPNECNICKCNDSGTSAICSLTQCPSKKITLPAEPKEVCKPYSVFKDYCNTCFCADDGLTFACTRMYCDKVIWNKDGSLKIAAQPQDVKIASEKQVCQPRTTFQDYCNTCFCDEEGLFFSCTRMYCDKEIWNKDGSLKVAAETSNKVCTPNSHFKEYCNTCVCSNDGSSKACTMMTCNENLWNKDGTTKFAYQSLKSGVEKVCEPGKAYSPDGCNTCICSTDGMNAACTMKLCFSALKQAYEAEQPEKLNRKYTQGDACVPGKIFYNDCNQCVCSRTGKSAFCTLKDCRTKV